VIGRFFRLQKVKFSTHGTVTVFPFQPIIFAETDIAQGRPLAFLRQGIDVLYVRMQTQVDLDDDEAPVLFDDVLIQRW